MRCPTAAEAIWVNEVPYGLPWLKRGRGGRGLAWKRVAEPLRLSIVEASSDMISTHCTSAAVGEGAGVRGALASRLQT